MSCAIYAAPLLDIARVHKHEMITTRPVRVPCWSVMLAPLQTSNAPLGMDRVRRVERTILGKFARSIDLLVKVVLGHGPRCCKSASARL